MKNKQPSLGQGYGYSNENGRFSVMSKGVKFFDKLSEAKKYYDGIKGGKAIWDVSNGIPELIDCV